MSHCGTCGHDWSRDVDIMAERSASLQSETARLREREAVLVEALNDALGPVVAWAATYAADRDMPNLDRQHQKLIDRIKALATNSDKAER